MKNRKLNPLEKFVLRSTFLSRWFAALCLVAAAWSGGVALGLRDAIDGLVAVLLLALSVAIFIGREGLRDRGIWLCFVIAKATISLAGRLARIGRIDFIAAAPPCQAFAPPEKATFNEATILGTTHPSDPAEPPVTVSELLGILDRLSNREVTLKVKGYEVTARAVSQIEHYIEENAMGEGATPPLRPWIYDKPSPDVVL